MLPGNYTFPLSLSVPWEEGSGVDDNSSPGNTGRSRVVFQWNNLMDFWGEVERARDLIAISTSTRRSVPLEQPFHYSVGNEGNMISRPGYRPRGSGGSSAFGARKRAGLQNDHDVRSERTIESFWILFFCFFFTDLRISFSLSRDFTRILIVDQVDDYTGPLCITKIGIIEWEYYCLNNFNHECS